MTLSGFLSFNKIGLRFWYPLNSFLPVIIKIIQNKFIVNNQQRRVPNERKKFIISNYRFHKCCGLWLNPVDYNNLLFFFRRNATRVDKILFIIMNNLCLSNIEATNNLGKVLRKYSSIIEYIDSSRTLIATLL